MCETLATPEKLKDVFASDGGLYEVELSPTFLSWRITSSISSGTLLPSTASLFKTKGKNLYVATQCL